MRYLRNGYTSWDGSYFVELDSARGIVAADPTAVVGYAMTALVSRGGRDRGARLPASRSFPEPLSLRVRRRPADDRRRDADRRVPCAATASKQSRWFCCRASMSKRRCATGRAESRRRRRCRRASVSGALRAGAPGTTSMRRSASRSSSSIWRPRRSSATATGVPFDVFQIDDGFTPGDGRLARGEAAVSARHAAAAGRHPCRRASRPGCGSRRSWSAIAAASTPSIRTGS